MQLDIPKEHIDIIMRMLVQGPWQTVDPVIQNLLKQLNPPPAQEQK